MGKGDRKTRKGKIAIRSYGNSRPHAAKSAATSTGTAKPAARTAAKPAAKKAAPVRKAAPKKSA
ncbi:MAG: 30S ribosomal protein THX [Lysobacteraceae bacterium]|jgi:ribosomal small subunit protein bTHX|nr:MAG: 30S ribosomal protein THX [Xanthomonadaceae bacterium]